MKAVKKKSKLNLVKGGIMEKQNPPKFEPKTKVIVKDSLFPIYDQIPVATFVVLATVDEKVLLTNLSWYKENELEKFDLTVYE